MTPTQEQGRQDVTLEVEGVKFYCQRNELSKQSPYFEAMFSDNFVEKHKDVIEIKGIDAVAMKFILQWLKDSSQIELLQGEDVLVVLQAAAMLQFEHLQQACEDAMVQRWMVAESCLQTASTADQLSLTKLYLRANAFALWHFPEVRHTQAFLDLSLTGLVEYLSNNALCLGSNESEFQVFEAVSCWLEHSILDRGEDTVKALSCVRMNFVSVHDIKNMLNYSCIDDSLDAQLLLNCVICLKEGKDVLPLGQSGVLTQESYSSGSEEAKGCCGTLKRIADHLKSRSCDTSPRDSSFDGSSSVMINEKNDDSIENNLSPSEKRFRYDILVSAHHILSIPKRKLPIVACIIGHNMKVDKNSTQDEENNLVSQEHSKKTRKDRNKNGTPHIFFWDADKSNKLIPLLPLTKIDQGPIEALGYTVISRGQDLFVVGGEYLLGYGNWNKSVWRYNVWSEVWTYETSLTVPRRHHSVVCLDDDMYIIGGCGKFRVILDTMDRYNFATHTWHKCPPLPHGLYSAATCVHNNLIYVILSQVYCFHPSSNTWDTLNVTKPAGASFNTAMPFGNYIYLTGLFSSDLMRFDPLGEKCIKCIGNFQNPAGDACLVGDKIYSFTEEDDKPCIEVFDIESGSFEVLWKGTSSDGKISFKKLGGCFPLVLYERLRRLKEMY